MNSFVKICSIFNAKSFLRPSTSTCLLHSPQCSCKKYLICWLNCGKPSSNLKVWFDNDEPNLFGEKFVRPIKPFPLFENNETYMRQTSLMRFEKQFFVFALRLNWLEILWKAINLSFNIIIIFLKTLYYVRFVIMIKIESH